MTKHSELQHASDYSPITTICVGVDDALDARLRGQAKNDEAAMPRVEQNAPMVSPEVRCSSTTARHLASADTA